MKEDNKKLFALARNAVKSAGCIILDNLDDRDFARLSKEVRQREKENAAQVTAWIWLNALVLHAEMAASGHGSLKFPWKEDAESLLAAWRSMLQRNSNLLVFQDALKAAQCLKRREALSKPLSELQVSAEKLWEMHAQPAAVCAQLFPEFASGRKETAAYYTTPSIAELLAGLALPPNAFETGADGENFKVVDVACGTGTLLVAAAKRLINLDPEKFQRGSLENVIHGYDTNVTALHMAATTLGLLAHDKPHYRSHLSEVPLGVGKDGEAKIGSLEFLRSNRIKGGRIGSESMGGFIEETPGSFDLVIMNPPYTRNDLRNQQFSDADKKKMQDREKKILAPWTMDKTLDLTSQANSFIVLANRFLKNGGTMAAVMPAAVTSNPSALGCRKYVAKKFTISAIVAVYDPDRPAFSESTGISEILLLCKKGQNVRRSPTKLIKIRQNPSTATEALRMANLINREMQNLDYDAPAGFHIDKIPYEKIASGDWSAINFLSPSLAAKFSDLREGRMFGKAIRFGDIIRDTLNGRYVRKDCEKDSLGDGAGIRCMWKNETDRITSLNPKFDSYLLPKKGREEQCRKHWARAGRLLFPAKIYLSEARVTAILADLKALGDQWSVVRVKGGEGISETDMEKAACAYLNSSLGILSILGGRDLQVFMRPAFSIDSLKSLPIPDFSGIGDVSRLAERFDALLGKEFRPLKEMDRCENRIELDSAVSDYLKIPKSVMEEIREKLVSEPVVSLKRWY